MGLRHCAGTKLALIQALLLSRLATRARPSHHVCLPDGSGHQLQIALYELKAGEGEGGSWSGPGQICQAASIETLHAILMVDLQMSNPPQQDAEIT